MNRIAPDRTCVVCSATFRGTGTMRTCSPVCRTLDPTAKKRRTSASSRNRARYGRPRVRLIEQVRAEENHCHLCTLGFPAVDGTRHPLAFTIDELVPLARGGTSDRSNVRAAHRACNSSRGARPITDDVQNRCRTLALRHFAALEAQRDPLAYLEEGRGIESSEPGTPRRWDPLESTCRHASLSIL